MVIKLIRDCIYCKDLKDVATCDHRRY